MGGGLDVPPCLYAFADFSVSWSVCVAQNPSVLAVTAIPNLLQQLQEANALLDTIQRGLNDYLETKRLAFARFFFLSNDELLEILAETKDPLRVQPHLRKCFEGIAKLQFSDSMDITAMFSAENERVRLRCFDVVDGHGRLFWRPNGGFL